MLLHPQALFIRNNSSVVSILSNIVSPSFYNLPDERYRICHVENMTFEDTASWVHTFCHHKGWDEAATYAKRFKDQEITGPLLSDLDDHKLEKWMEITNSSHRAELMSAIEYLVPKSPIPYEYGASEMHQLAPTPGSQRGILYPMPLLLFNSVSSVFDNQNSMGTVVYQSQCESSMFGTYASRSSIDRQSESESSLRNITCLPNTVGDRLDCDSGIAPSQVGSFGIELASHEQTDMSVLSDSECSKRSSPVRQMNVHGSGTSKSANISEFRLHNRNTRDIQKPDMPALKGPHMGHNHHLPTKKTRSVNVKKLILTLESGQIPENGDADMTDEIKSWFVKSDSAVTVKPMEDHRNKYTIIFRDIGAANEALKLKDKRFNIRNKYPPRACPSCHIKYKALDDLIVRKGKSLRNYKKGVVKRGESVWVDQVKGRRARVMNRGWVSLYTKDGTPLFIQDVSC